MYKITVIYSLIIIQSNYKGQPGTYTTVGVHFFLAFP